MLNICSESSKGFNKIIHNLLDLTVQHFFEIGRNLEYEEILGSVFPSYRQSNQEFGIKILNKIYRDMNDNFVHQLTPFEEYILYHYRSLAKLVKARLFLYEHKRINLEFCSII